MSLAYNYSPYPNPNPSNLPPRQRPFDQTLILRLSSLLHCLRHRPPPSLPLSSLTLAVDLLSSTLRDFAALLCDPTLPLSAADVSAISSHLDSSAALLSAANYLTSAVDRLSRLRLHLSYAVHLLAKTPELTPKASASIAEWTDNLRKTSTFLSPDELIRTAPPRGKISAVIRAIYAVEAVSGLVVGLASSFLGSRPDLESLRVSGEFPWSTTFNGVLTAVSGRGGGLAVEFEAVDAGVRELTAGNGDVEELSRLTEELTVGLDGLGNAINGLFWAGLDARNAALLGFRIGPKKCAR